jgi:hypothetical protein
MPGQAWHHGVCDFKAIPVYRPLDVPEPTTWGESGGEEAITDVVDAMNFLERSKT